MRKIKAVEHGIVIWSRRRQRRHREKRLTTTDEADVGVCLMRDVARPRIWAEDDAADP